MAKKVVMDTNVIVSSIFWMGRNPNKLVSHAIKLDIVNYTSPEILAELDKVLRVDFKVTDEIARRQMALVRRYSLVVEPSQKIDAIKDDPKDNMILECADSCKADFIITGDNHLLKLKEFRGIKILNPKAFLETIEKE